MKSKRAKSKHGIYGERTERLNAFLTPEAKQGIQSLAQQTGVSVNEFMELLGKGQISLKLQGE